MKPITANHDHQISPELSKAAYRSCKQVSNQRRWPGFCRAHFTQLRHQRGSLRCPQLFPSGFHPVTHICSDGFCLGSLSARRGTQRTCQHLAYPWRRSLGVQNLALSCGDDDDDPWCSHIPRAAACKLITNVCASLSLSPITIRSPCPSCTHTQYTGIYLHARQTWENCIKLSYTTSQYIT